MLTCLTVDMQVKVVCAVQVEVLSKLVSKFLNGLINAEGKMS